MKVLDASGVINLRDRELEGDFITIREAEAELRDIQSRMKFEAAVAAGKIRFDEPSKKVVKEVSTRAADIGCLQMLSPTDIRLLALALEKKLPIVTDDYDIQNMCAELGLVFEKVSMRGIRARRAGRFTLQRPQSARPAGLRSSRSRGGDHPIMPPSMAAICLPRSATTTYLGILPIMAASRNFFQP
jgi:UPF0271 protein